MSVILSIDVGIKNLSYCLFSVSNDCVSIKDWKNLIVIEGNTKKVEFDELVEYVLDTLSEEFSNNDFAANTVLIENQPMLKNGLMKTISVVIYTYFKMMSIQTGCIDNVKFVSASNKLKCKRKPIDSECSKASYKDRKQLSIQIALQYINRLCPDKLNWFHEQKKKDDLADAMCQGIYYIENKLKIADKFI